ncbi:MAG: hypothetical protein V3S70_01120 [Gammaproteobacteria bacterium]
MPRRDHTLTALCIAMLTSPVITEANDDELPDAEFLEYLGSLEDDDANWTDVLELPELAAQGETDKDEQDDGVKDDGQ